MFSHSLNPMLVADDERRYVDANPAACLLFRLPREELLALRIDDITTPELRRGLEARWEEFLRDGVRIGRQEFLMPDGARLEVEYSATANFEPGRHLSILVPSPGRPTSLDANWVAASEGPHLTEREREVLERVALGETGETIAGQLGVATTTVESHVRNGLGKLGARNRAHGIALALARGEITLGSVTVSRRD